MTGMTADHAVRLERVRKRFGEHLAVDELSLDVPQGSIYGLMSVDGRH
jgi:ABC-type uncharacterized transport system ATPase subunit